MNTQEEALTAALREAFKGLEIGFEMLMMDGWVAQHDRGRAAIGVLLDAFERTRAALAATEGGDAHG